jgi:hypothetical protein
MKYVIAAGIAAIQKPRMAYTQTHPCDWIPTSMLTAIKLSIFPFALSLSKGEWKNPSPEVKPFMLRQAQHERLTLKAVNIHAGMTIIQSDFLG